MRIERANPEALSEDNMGPLSVSELLRALGHALEQHFPRVSFQGEISEFTRAASGHLYFTVKDESAQVSAVMWRGTARALQFQPEPGMAVLCEGKPNIYPRSGRMQMVVARMLLAGEGLLQQKFLELKAKLEKEGLFEQARKRELPFFPKTIGVVTSASGAAIHDIMTRVRERMPNTKVVLYNARVQGEGSVEEIVEGIRTLNARRDVEVLIVGRGGGSLEDLWSFNEEAVVRAIFGSRLPVISAVGHEVDITLADLVADHRSPTPTAAGERVVPSADELLQDLDALHERLLDLDGWLYPLFEDLDLLEQRLSRRITELTSQARLRLKTASAHLASIRPDRMLENFRSKLSGHARSLEFGLRGNIERAVSRLDAQDRRFIVALERMFDQKKGRLDRVSTRLTAVSPVAVLKRGYSIVERGGAVISKSSQLKSNDDITVLFSEGSATAKVLKIQEK